MEQKLKEEFYEKFWNKAVVHINSDVEQMLNWVDKNFLPKNDSSPVEPRVMRKIAGIQWEQRYSKTLDNDKFGRWMRIGRINGMTVAIITKAEVENKPTRFVVKLPNNRGDESLQNNIILLSENEAMNEAEKYIAKYVSNFSA